MLKDLEKELKRWREKRAQKPAARSRETALPSAADRRTVRVNGQEVVVVKRGRKALA
jgi:hypothetical protein